MKPRPRKCKNKGCNNTFTPFNSVQNWCSPACGFELSKTKVKKEFNKETKRRKKKLLDEDLSHQHKLTQAAVNKLCLLRDEGKACISCRTTSPYIQYACGHFKTRGAFPELRYNFANLSRQCNKKCNLELSGNVYEYAKGIVDRYGQERLDYLDGPHERIKYTCSDLIEFRKEVNQIIRDMESGQEFRLPSKYQDN